MKDFEIIPASCYCTLKIIPMHIFKQFINLQTKKYELKETHHGITDRQHTGSSGSHRN
jgi:hypothetical protein